MDVLSALRERRSTRDFKPDPVPPELLQQCLDDARWAPSWSNTQPYRVAVAQGALRDRLSKELGALYDDGIAAEQGGPVAKLRALATGRVPKGDFHVPRVYPAELQPARRSSGFGLYGVLGIAREDRAARVRQTRRNYDFFGAPVALFVFVHEGLGVYAPLDAGIFLQSFLLACQARGLGTCAQGALAVWAKPMREAFQVPPHYRLLVGCSVGYPSAHPVNAFNPGRAELGALLLPPR